MSGFLNILLAANAQSDTNQLNIINFRPIDDYINNSFVELRGGTYTPTGDKLIVQDDTTDRRFYEIALSPAWFGLPADDAGATQDGSTGRSSTHQYINMFWNGDGTRLWGCRSGTDIIDGYDLGTPYDITSLTSATPDQEVDFGTAFESTAGGVNWGEFSLDGTKFFALHNASRSVLGFYEYPLDVAYDLTSYSSGVVDGPKNGTDDIPENNATGVAFNGDHTRLYAYTSNPGTDWTIGQVNLDAADDLSSWTNTGTHYNVGFIDSEPSDSMVISETDEYMMIIRRDLAAKTTDVRLYVDDGDDAFMSRFAEVGIFTPGGSADTSAIFVSSDGTRLVEFHDTGSTGPVFGYTLSTPYDITTAGSGTNSSNVARLRARLHVNDAGTQIWGGDSSTADIWTATLGTPWDFSTMSALSAENPTTATLVNVRGIEFTNSGLTATIHDPGADLLYQFTLATPYDLTSDTSNVSRHTGAVGSPPPPLALQYFGGFNHDGTRMFFARTQSTWFAEENIFSYIMSTPYDIETATFDNNFFHTHLNGTVQGLCYAREGTTDHLYYTGTSPADQTIQLTYQEPV
jgi:hypothetical protein